MTVAPSCPDPLVPVPSRTDDCGRRRLHGACAMSAARACSRSSAADPGQATVIPGLRARVQCPSPALFHELRVAGLRVPRCPQFPGRPTHPRAGPQVLEVGLGTGPETWEAALGATCVDVPGGGLPRRDYGVRGNQLFRRANPGGKGGCPASASASASASTSGFGLRREDPTTAVRPVPEHRAAPARVDVW